MVDAAFVHGDVVVVRGVGGSREGCPVTVRGRRPVDDAVRWVYSVEFADGETSEIDGSQLAEPGERSGTEFRHYVEAVAVELTDHGVELSAGLEPIELAAVEDSIGSQLPPELREFLTVALPVGEKWPDWRSDPAGVCSWTRQWLEKMFAFDIEQNDYWSPLFGERPPGTSGAIAQAIDVVRTWPPLVRVYGHRFMPTDPAGWGNPVLSVWQAVDSIVYGADFAAYLAADFRVSRPWWAKTNARRVPIWGQALEI